ncbi:MAG TPA: RDD family protein [Chitinophagaceae bacterium]
MENKYPDLKTRIQSTFIDGILMIVLMFAAAWVFDKVSNSENEDGWVRAVVFIGIWVIYEPLLMTLGGTLGNYMMGIRVRKENDTTKKINLLQAFLRFVVKFFLGWISFLTIHTNVERRALHDFAGGSVVIEK